MDPTGRPDRSSRRHVVGAAAHVGWALAATGGCELRGSKSKFFKMAKDEICFEAPEINMASDIVLDARVSIVTVTKLVDVRVSGACKCP